MRNDDPVRNQPTQVLVHPDLSQWITVLPPEAVGSCTGLANERDEFSCGVMAQVMGIRDSSGNVFCDHSLCAGELGTFLENFYQLSASVGGKRSDQLTQGIIQGNQFVRNPASSIRLGASMPQDQTNPAVVIQNINGNPNANGKKQGPMARIKSVLGGGNRL